MIDEEDFRKAVQRVRQMAQLTTARDREIYIVLDYLLDIAIEVTARKDGENT